MIRNMSKSDIGVFYNKNVRKKGEKIMNENEEKIILKKKAALQCRLEYSNEEINRLEEEITLSEKEKKNREHIKELEEIKREIPNFSEDVYKQYKRYFEAEEKINNIAENEEVKIKYLKEKLEYLVFEQKFNMAELEKIDNELTHLTKEEISK